MHTRGDASLVGFPHMIQTSKSAAQSHENERFILENITGTHAKGPQ
jgi:hypothetical protein